MNVDLARLRLQKVLYALFHPTTWRGALHGVFASVEHRAALAGLSFDRVFDVGANRGQFCLLMRSQYPLVPVVSFEPLPDEAKVFRAVHIGDSLVRLETVALGEASGSATMHVSHRADCSSLLPIGDLQSQIFPRTGEVGALSVRVERLDALSSLRGDATNMLLKLDVQGFELSVLKGAIGILGQCRYVYCECSEVALYVGQAMFHEVQEFLAEHGFRLAGRYNDCVHGGKLIQADYLFARD